MDRLGINKMKQGEISFCRALMIGGVGLKERETRHTHVCVVDPGAAAGALTLDSLDSFCNIIYVKYLLSYNDKRACIVFALPSMHVIDRARRAAAPRGSNMKHVLPNVDEERESDGLQPHKNKYLSR